MKDTDKLIEGCGALVFGMIATAINPALATYTGAAGLLIAGGASIRAQRNVNSDRAAQRVLTALNASPEFAQHISEAATIVGNLKDDLSSQIGTTSLVQLSWHEIPEQIAKPVLEKIDPIASDGARRVVGLVLTECARALTDDEAFRIALRDDRSQAILSEVLALGGALDRQTLTLLNRIDGLKRALTEGLGAALIRLASRIASDVNDPHSALVELARAVDIAERLQREGNTQSNHAGFVDQVMARVAALARDSRYADAGNEIDAALARDEEETRARRSKLFDRGIEVATLARDPARVADLLVRKGDLEAGGRMSFDDLRARFIEWYERGRDRGLNLDLAVSIDLARHSCQRAVDADKRGIALNDLGSALQALGTREAAPKLLEEAVAVYRAALRERARDWVPVMWARTKMNLGSALRALGEREPGTARLEEAVVAYRAALEELTRDRARQDWAMAQMNLGNALQTLGAREPGTARLEEAVVAYRAALEERNRGREPLDWAQAKSNLGIALSCLGEREPGTVRLEEAVAAYRAALEELTRDRVPLDWARTQMHLGNVQSTLGERERSPTQLEEAIFAFRAALEEWTHDRVPLDWAMAQMNLGAALWSLGILEPGTARLEEAVGAYRAAMEELTRERAPLDWANALGNEGIALYSLSARTNDVVMARRALEQAREAERVLHEGGHEARAINFRRLIPVAEALVARLEASS